MSASRHISLFSERPELNQHPSSFVVSVVAHAAAVVLLSFGIIYTPDLNDRIVTKHYTVRHLDLHASKTPPRQSAGKGISYPGPHTALAAATPGKFVRPASPQTAMRQTADAEKGPQTLIQPDISEPVKLALEAPVPSLAIWTPAKVEVKKLVAPLPEKPTVSEVKPSVNTPNQELNLADLGISSANRPTLAHPVAPATTSPLVVHGPSVVQLAPVTVSQRNAQPTPTAVMSISDLRMPDGTVTLPPVNETVLQSELGAMVPGKVAAGDRASQDGGDGVKPAAGNQGVPSTVIGQSSGTQEGRNSGSGLDQGLTTEHFVLPRNGQFGAVVVGASLEEEFPEMYGIWNNRVAYTVYLHVGLKRSWILQYSLPRDTEAEEAGNVTRLEAPWPFNIVRPNLSPDSLNTDALLVHGYVNVAGKFESLAIAFPPEFRQAQFVLDSLSQWQFRPAVQNGKVERVEVLLIVPEEPEE